MTTSTNTIRRSAGTLIGLAVVTAALLASTLATASPARAELRSNPPCISAAPKKANGTPWVCTFYDEFNGTTLDSSKWAVQTSAASGFGTTGECYVNDGRSVGLANGMLGLVTRKQTAPFTCNHPGGVSYTTRVTSGSISTYQKFSQTYGRFEIRAKFPPMTGPGLHGALWLWPDNPLKYGAWPSSGEIDIAEVYSLHNDRAIPFIHYLPGKLSQTNNYCVLDVTEFHDYVAEWTPTTITITFDGNVCVQDTITPAAPLVAPQPFDHPFMVALTEGLGVGANAMDPANDFGRKVLWVEYVRVYK
jgi:beta-glucanase (GH16 family)